MDELINRLEKQIKALLDQHDRLKDSNSVLSRGIVREKELLLQKQQKAITQIQTLVSRLKTIETAEA